MPDRRGPSRGLVVSRCTPHGRNSRDRLGQDNLPEELEEHEHYGCFGRRLMVSVAIVLASLGAALLLDRFTGVLVQRIARGRYQWCLTPLYK